MTEPGWLIAALKAADLAVVLEIDRQSPSPWSLTQFGEEMAARGGMQLICRSRSDGCLAGFLLARFLPDEAEILRLATAREFQRLGVASRLLEAFFAAAGAQHIRRIHLELRAANLPARSLYEKFAFEMTGRRPRYYTEPIDDAICLTRVLGQAQSP